MERVEAPLRDEAIGDQVAHFLETARPDEVERFVRDGLARSLDRYWRRMIGALQRWRAGRRIMFQQETA